LRGYEAAADSDAAQMQAQPNAVDEQNGTVLL
jgi:hypothetical protein